MPACYAVTISSVCESNISEIPFRSMQSLSNMKMLILN